MPKLQDSFTLKSLRETRERPCGVLKLRFFSRDLAALQLAYVFETATVSRGAYRLTGLNDGEYRGQFFKGRVL